MRSGAVSRRSWGRILAAIAVLAVASVPASGRTSAEPGPDAPDHLLVDGLSAPIGIDDIPQFAWRVNDARRGASQRAYRVLVGTAPVSTPGDAGVVWDSGVVESNKQAFVAYGGPQLASDSDYWWTVSTADGGGRFSDFAAPQRFETGLHDGDWRAQWIRRTPTNAVDKADDYTYARKEFALEPSPIVRATAYVSADHQYQLWINGSRAAAGEAFSYPDSQYYEATDITALLKSGTANAIGLLYHWYGVGKGRPEGASGVIVQVSLVYADGVMEHLGTDGSWRVTRAPWLPATQRNTEGDPVDYTEHIDGATYPTGWDRAGFDDRLWQPATVLGTPPIEPWTHLSSVRTRVVEEAVAPASITSLTDGSVVADFGRVIAAVPTVSFRSGVAGRTVSMHAGYLLDESSPGAPVVGVSGQVSTTHGTQHTDMSYAYVEASGAQTFRPFDYLGFRYFQIDDPGEPLDASQIVAYARHNALPNGEAASFSSSDASVDAVFALAQHSAAFGSQEQFIDTPTREKGPFLRDSFNISETAMRAFGEQNLSRRALLEFAQSQTRYWPDGHLNAIYPSGQGKRDIPDFTEIYPEWVWQYYLDTGDDELLADVYPVMAAISSYVARDIDPTTGLVTNLAGGDGDYLYGIVDWPMNMRYGYDMSTAVRTTVNLLAVDVFDRTATAADALGHDEDAGTQRARRDALVAAINARLRRSDGIYVDGLHADGTQSDHASQHANAYAIAYGVAPADSDDTVADYVASRGMAMGPQTAQLLLSALHTVGRDADLVTRIADATTDGWANVLARGGTFTWETWQPSDANGDSMSHAWGSTVLVNIQDALLGITPTAPADEMISFRPPRGGLDQASGTMPTTRGPVSVSWQRPADASGAFTVALTIPANMRASVAIPATSPDSITENGQPLVSAPGVELQEIQGDLVILAVGSGDYSFASGSVPSTFVGHTPGHPAPNATEITNGGVEDRPASSTGRSQVAGPTSKAATPHRDHVPAWLVVVLVAAQITTAAIALRVRNSSRAT